MDKNIKDSVLAIRDSGKANMLDIRAVMQIADRKGDFALVCFLAENRQKYFEFIMFGKE